MIRIEFALPYTLLKLKKQTIIYCIGQGSVKNVILHILLCSPGRKMQNLFLIKHLNVIGAVFNFKVIGKVLDYTSSIWFGKLFLHVSFVVVTG